MKVKLFNSFVNNLQEEVGELEFNDTAKAHFVYQMLKVSPNEFTFKTNYYVDKDGKKHLTSISIMGKHGDKHPITFKRRLQDKIRVSLRKLKK